MVNRSSGSVAFGDDRGLKGGDKGRLKTQTKCVRCRRRGNISSAEVKEKQQEDAGWTR